MHITVSTHSTTITATISGRFDAHGIDEFDRQVVELIDASRPNVIIVLSEVEFMDSSALAGLVRALKATVVHSGSVTLVAVSDAVRIILELTRLDAVFTSVPTMADARERLTLAA